MEKYLAKKYKIDIKKAKEYYNIAVNEAKDMGKSGDKKYIEEIFKSLLNIKESIEKYNRKYFYETIMSSSIPQNVRPEYFVGNKEDKEKEEELRKKLKGYLKIKK